MRLPVPVLSALLVLLLAAARCMRADGRSMLDLIGRNPRTRTEPAELGRARPPPRSHQGLGGHPRDPHHKEKFIRHLTGPLYFNPKCIKHFKRLYDTTRDCTEPKYYKRCARLLIRLANSPRCAGR